MKVAKTIYLREEEIKDVDTWRGSSWPIPSFSEAISTIINMSIGKGKFIRGKAKPEVPIEKFEELIEEEIGEEGTT